MLFTTLAVATVAAIGVSAQTPKNSTICDYYTTALLKNNTAANQLTLLTLVVNTAIIGNYTQPNVGVKVPGLLSPGVVNGTNVDLLGYFNGSLVSSNKNGVPTAINWLDDGGAVPLKANKPANGTTSNQYMLLTHLYSFFGAALGCSLEGNGSFPAYAGEASMYSVHQFMDLSNAEVTWFIENVGLSAASFGVAPADVTAAGTLLASVFGVKCAAATTVIPAQGPQLQSICVDSTCPQAKAANCSAYAAETEPKTASGTQIPSATSGSSGSTGTGGASTPSSSSSAGSLGVSSGLAVLAALFALIV